MPTEPQLEPYYLPLDGLDGGRFHATFSTTGPWFADAQHAGPPSALLIRALERCDARPGTELARITVEVIGPVPAGEVRVHAQVERPGRAVELLAAELVAGGRPVLRARAWRMATGDTSTVAHGSADPLRRTRDGAGAHRAAAGLAARVHRRHGVAVAAGLAGRAGAGHGVGPAAGAAGGRRGAEHRCSGWPWWPTPATAPRPRSTSAVAVRQHRAHPAPAPGAAGRVDRGAGADGRRTDRYRDRLRAAVRQPRSGRALARRRCWSGRADWTA